MTPEEFNSLLRAMLPYVNSGMIVLDINLLLRRGGLEISLGEYQKKPLSSLILGLTLISIGGFFSSLAQTYLLGVDPLLVFLVLIVAYILILAEAEQKKRKKRRR